MIDFYGQYNDIKSATNVFTSIPTKYINVICIRAMMKSLTNNNYNQFFKRNNYTTHSCALKACMNMNDIKQGMIIIDFFNKSTNSYSDELSNTE